MLLPDLALAETKCFLAMQNNKVIKQEGDDCVSRHSPCSTFKIALSLMGYNEGLLLDETNPQWPFKEGYLDSITSWKQPHNPTSWIKNSCVWYSQVLTPKIGLKKFKEYVSKFNYGNQDISGDTGLNNGLTNAWLSSSLQISPQEKINFLQKLIDNELPVSQKSMEMTKKILFVENWTNGWKFYGKTGSGFLLNNDGSRNKEKPIGWFVGWVQNGNKTIVFTHYIEGKNGEEYKDFSSGKKAKEIAKEKLMQLISETN